MENVTIAVNAAQFTFYRNCGWSVRKQLAIIGAALPSNAQLRSAAMPAFKSADDRFAPIS
jgi:hypothetical protein